MDNQYNQHNNQIINNMPYKSLKQEKWAHTKAGMKKLGKKVVAEFDKASKGKKLPKRAKKKK